MCRCTPVCTSCQEGRPCHPAPSSVQLASAVACEQAAAAAAAAAAGPAASSTRLLAAVLGRCQKHRQCIGPGDPNISNRTGTLGALLAQASETSLQRPRDHVRLLHPTARASIASLVAASVGVNTTCARCRAAWFCVTHWSGVIRFFAVAAPPSQVLDLPLDTQSLLRSAAHKVMQNERWLDHLVTLLLRPILSRTSLGERQVSCAAQHPGAERSIKPNDSPDHSIICENF